MIGYLGSIVYVAWKLKLDSSLASKRLEMSLIIFELKIIYLIKVLKFYCQYIYNIYIQLDQI